jgi:hypothetical protein
MSFLAWMQWIFILGTPLLVGCQRFISFHEIKKDERCENVVFEKPHVTFNLHGSLHINYHNSLMGSQKDDPFVGVESRPHYLSTHMHHAW